MAKISNKTVIQTACNMPDLSACPLAVHVENGRIVKITPGDFPEPFYKGACANGLLLHRWAYHPDRLRHPLKRMGERGGGKWKRISWEEALNEISAKLIGISEAYGPTSVAWSVPDAPMLSQGGYSRLVTLTKGTWIENWGFGDLAGPCADVANFGRIGGGAFGTVVEKPNFVIVWGGNPAYTYPTSMKAILGAKKMGARVVCIDPRYTATAARVDEHIPIRPGTDGALALGMLNAILEKGLEDAKFITEHTIGPVLVRADNGFFLRGRDIAENTHNKQVMIWDRVSGRAQPLDVSGIKPALEGRYSISGIDCKPAYQLLLDMVKEYTLDKVAGITEIPIETIKRLAMNYATRKPAAIYRGMGMQRSFHGDLSWRAINTLAAVTGNINLKYPATFTDYYVGDRVTALYFPEPALSYNRIPIMNLYDAITKERPFPIKALCFAMHNFVTQLPNAKKILNELFPRLELILVCDLFMTSTAKYADYVLPVTSLFERTDLMPPIIIIPYVQLQPKIIVPLYECKSDFQIAAALGRKMGFGKYFEKTEEEYIKEILDSHPLLEGITLEQLKEGPVKARPSFGPPIRTPTGKIEFYVEKLKEFGQELPIYLEPVESLRQEKAKQYDLSLLTPHPKYRIHSTMANVPQLLKLDPEPLLEIHPIDAAARGIEEGDMVYVYNDRGKVKVRAKITTDIKSSVVSITEGWWPDHFVEGHYQDLTHDMINPAQNAFLGSNAALNDVLVSVQKVEQ